MELIPVLFLTALLVGYFVLAGCDVGLGMLMPYLARTRGERRRAVSAAAPYFLGTEVWLVGAIGVVAGLFPELKTAVVTGMWPVFSALLAGWLLRDAGLWFRARAEAPSWHGLWDAAIVGGSWTIAVCWGLVGGALLAGGTLASPFAAAVAALVVVLFLLRGAAFGAERLVPPGREADDADGPVGGDAVGGAAGSVGSVGTVPAARVAQTAVSADAAARLTRVLARAGLAVLAVAVLLGAFPGTLDGGLPLAAAAGAALVAVALAATAGTEGPGRSRHASALAMGVMAPAVGVGAALPVEPVPGAVLTLVAVALAPVVPLMVVGQVALYRMLRRPASATGFFAQAAPAVGVGGGARTGAGRPAGISRFRPTAVGGPQGRESHGA
ncbi:cytochrome d ubiquinol oxidase subunit II [Nocardiopsis sp. RSe5-2]|uniref:Cytochrome d ubiquinol oxidase subunit II n=1 Tax=Nocardiopsis endophytica TaxID=3018445 RepID=A0ABT4U2B6_9ACTN|nr:cytochrome d ubiquinol oxidase subunit II [Nocardiopsis endophytica]MDA2811087.1 cytochrome d ubiquinol oxidase subunit II [Nocardiopsis endophytica]